MFFFAYFFLQYFYSPKKLNLMKHNVLIWGYFSTFVLLLGTIFMNLDFIAGKVLFLVGFFTFNLGYLIPLFLVLFRESQENQIGLIIILSILGFFIFLMGITFFMVNWGGSMVLIYVGGSFLLLTSILMLFMWRRFYETSVDSWFPIVLFAVFVVIGMLTSMVHRPVLRSFTINNQEDMVRMQSLKDINGHIYNELERICGSDSSLVTIMVKADSVVAQSECMLDYIDSLKRELIVYVEGKKMLQDSNIFYNLVPIQSSVEINSVRRFMLGRKRHNAYILHNRLDRYRNSLLSMDTTQSQWMIRFIETSLNTEVLKLNKRNYNRSWEKQQFYNFPLVTVISQLTRLQVSISLVQGEMLNNYRRMAIDSVAVRYAIIEE